MIKLLLSSKGRKIILLVVIVLIIAFAGSAVAYAAFLGDSGTVDVRVPNKTQSVVDATTKDGAFVSYFGSSDVNFGASGTGTFDPFVRLQGSPTEQGYNTSGVTQFDTKVGTWTHAILVSHIPQRPCPQASPSLTCFELFVDINENNSTSYISLNKVEVYFTDSATLSGYPFGSAATAEYTFNGDILIHDVNQGSGRADLRYDIPINSPGKEIDIASIHCDFGNPACSTYFVLYSQWGTTGNLNGTNYNSDGGFEEWKVRVYPAISLTKTPNVSNVCNGSNTQVTYTYVVTNNGSESVSGTVVDDNGTPSDTTDDVTVGTFSSLAPGANQSFTHAFTVNGTRTNIAKATASDSSGATTTASATATVTGKTCSISVTKTPSTTSICNGANTQVTFTYVVKNTGDFFAVSGSLTDDKLGDIGSFGPLAPGASATLTKVGTINETQTNKATATGTFTDAAATTATATDTATVNGHDCSISVTKTPSQTSVCNGSPVTYAYEVANNSDAFTWTGSLSDDKLGDIASSITLTPGESKTFTASGDITGTVTNTVTASGTFNDPATASASATDTATVTGHTCSISVTKTPSTTSICNGANTLVTYTYVVTNDSDAFNVSGKVTDDKLGDIGTFGPLAPGTSTTLTKDAAVNATQTNTATATGTFDDAASTSDTTTATATVTGHDCSISVTKTPSTTSICKGANTQVTYTYVVKNTGDFFNVSGTLSDDVLGTIGTFGPLAPGASQTLTAVGTVNDTVTNTATASGTFDDSAGTKATATDTATVTGHDCSITVTKTPSQTSVCNDSPVTYTYVVTNNSDIYTWTGSLSDDKLGDVASSITLAPGESQTFTASGTINGTVTNTATAIGTFNDPAGASANATATATVTGQNCAVAQITPTNTSCGDFASGAASTLDALQYTVKDGQINSVAPGVFFYWIKVTLPEGSNSITLHQAITTGNFDSHFFSFAAGSNVFNSSCTAVNGVSITQNGADVTATFNTPSAGTYYMGIKYDATSVKSYAVPSPTTVHYTFTTIGFDNSEQGLDLEEK